MNSGIHYCSLCESDKEFIPFFFVTQLNIYKFSYNVDNNVKNKEGIDLSRL